MGSWWQGRVSFGELQAGFPQVGVMSLSTRNRRMSVTPLAGVERQGRGSLGGGGLALGLQDTLSCGLQTVRGTHPLPVLQSLFHQGQGLGVGGALSCQDGSGGACFSSVARVLQPVVCGDEGLRVLETGYRSFSTESEDAQDFLQDGDSPVCSSLGSTRRLDGVSRLEGCLLAGSGSSGQPQLPQIRSFWPGVPIQGSVLWSLHGTSGFYQGHGSGLGFPSSGRHPHPSLPGQLADPSCISFAGHVGLGCGSSSLSVAGNSRQLGEVSSGACAADDISCRSSGLAVFQGLSCPEESRKASLNRRRIPILRRAASFILARALGSPVIADSLSSRRSSQNALSSASTSSILASPRPVSPGAVILGLPARSRVVVGVVSSRRGRSPASGVA